MEITLLDETGSIYICNYNGDLPLDEMKLLIDQLKVDIANINIGDLIVEELNNSLLIISEDYNRLK